MDMYEIKRLVNEGEILKSVDKDFYHESSKGSYVYIGKYKDNYFVFDEVEGLDMGDNKMMGDFEEWLEGYEYEKLDDKGRRELNRKISAWVLDNGLFIER